MAGNNDTDSGRPAARRAALVMICAALCPAMAAQAGEVMVAVAANFTAPMQKIAALFEQESGHRAVLAFGSTGRFYAQIRNGAPFQMLLAADDETPARLEKEGLTLAGTRHTYAVGRLVLWSAQAGLVDDKGEILRTGHFDRLAIADPRLAPYGQAAIETLTRLGLAERLKTRLVQGESIAQAFQFVATGNAALGFVALSQVMQDGQIGKGSAWRVPDTLHAPIRQDMVILSGGRDNPAAAALLRFMGTDKVRQLIKAYGYGS